MYLEHDLSRENDKFDPIPCTVQLRLHFQTTWSFYFYHPADGGKVILVCGQFDHQAELMICWHLHLKLPEAVQYLCFLTIPGPKESPLWPGGEATQGLMALKDRLMSLFYL